MTLGSTVRWSFLALVLVLAVAGGSCPEPESRGPAPVVDGRPAPVAKTRPRPVAGPSSAAGTDPGLALPRHPDASGSGTIQVSYEESDAYDSLARSLAGSGIFEQMAQAVTDAVALPTDLEAVFTECGEANAYWVGGRIVMCYELFEALVDVFLGFYEESETVDAQALQRQVFGAGAFVYLHEIGHALVDQLQVPITAREEDSVDSLAALTLILGGGEDVLWAALQHFAVMAGWDDSAGFFPFWDEHSMAAQRYYDLVCMIYGSDPEGWGHIVPEYLPEKRAPRCQEEFWQKAIGWDRLLAPYYHLWPLPCSPFPPQGEPVAECARRAPDGEIVLRPGVLPSAGEVAAVQAVIVEGELLFALVTGRTAPALPFDNGPDAFVEGLARTIRDGKVGFVDRDLELVVPRKWDFALPFEDGVARVCSGCAVVREEGDEHATLAGGLWGMIDREGRILVPVEHAWEHLPPRPR